MEAALIFRFLFIKEKEGIPLKSCVNCCFHRRHDAAAPGQMPLAAAVRSLSGLLRSSQRREATTRSVSQERRRFRIKSAMTP